MKKRSLSLPDTAPPQVYYSEEQDMHVLSEIKHLDPIFIFKKLVKINVSVLT